MPPTRAEKRKQQKAVARRQVIRQTTHSQATHKPALSAARYWPLHTILLTREWQNTEKLTQILISRQGPDNLFAIGVILVDLACLGVKNAFGRVVDALDYQTIFDSINDSQEMSDAEPNLVAKIVREAVAYAGELGFRPHRDISQALAILGPADPDACAIPIPLGGNDGKPYFIAGPRDNSRIIIDKLTKAVGEGNFNYFIPIDPDSDLFALDN